jgi:hypothetical protein
MLVAPPELDLALCGRTRSVMYRATRKYKNVDYKWSNAILCEVGQIAIRNFNLGGCPWT